MNNFTNTDYKSKPLDFDPRKNCAKCRCNGGTKKHTYYFAYNRKAKICIFCEVDSFKSTGDIVEWLEQHALYSETGKLVDFNSKPIRRNLKMKKELLKKRGRSY